MFDREETLKVLRAIHDGYPQLTVEGLIVVENPYFQPDNGSNPNLVLDVQELIWYLEQSEAL